MIDRFRNRDDGRRTTDNGQSSPSRLELLLVGLTLVVGFALRIAAPSHIAVEHFDEGVYAANRWFAEGRYPARHLYAPPLVPAAIEFSLLLFGTGGVAAMVPGLLAGTLTIAVMWWIARAWFGPAAGIAAALLCATSDVHLLYSRTALTEPVLCLWLPLAVYFGWKALCGGGAGWSLAAGAVAALAWWTKYSGWLPLAIVAAGGAAWVLDARRGRWRAGSESDGATRARPGAKRLLVSVLLMSVTAFALFSPVLVDLQQHGGYAAVARNHSQYIVGFTGWWASLHTQAAHLNFIDGIVTALGIALAVVAGAAATMFAGDDSSPGTDRPPGTARRVVGQCPLVRADKSATTNVLVAASALSGIAVLFGSPLVLALASLAGIALAIRALRAGTAHQSARSDDSVGNAHPTPLAGWTLAAWFAGLLLATPFYRPFPRLTLPWVMASWLGAAACIGKVVESMLDGPSSTEDGDRRSDIEGRGSKVGGGSRVESRGSSANPPALDPRLSTLDLSSPSSPRGRAFRGLVPAIGLAVAIGAWTTGLLTGRARPPVAWEDRRGVLTAAEQFAGAVRGSARQSSAAETSPIVLVYAEPAMVHQLSALGLAAVPLADLDAIPAEIAPSAPRLFLVAGPHAWRDERFLAGWKTLAGRVELVDETPYEPSTLVLLNHYPPSALRDSAIRPSDRRFRLYRVLVSGEW